MSQVGVDGVRRGEEVPGDAAIRQPLPDELSYRTLTRGQALPAGQRSAPAPAAPPSPTKLSKAGSGSGSERSSPDRFVAIDGLSQQRAGFGRPLTERENFRGILETSRVIERPPAVCCALDGAEHHLGVALDQSPAAQRGALHTRDAGRERRTLLGAVRDFQRERGLIEGECEADERRRQQALVVAIVAVNLI